MNEKEYSAIVARNLTNEDIARMPVTIIGRVVENRQKY